LLKATRNGIKKPRKAKAAPVHESWQFVTPGTGRGQSTDV
jgi:hypothetical protein